MPAKKIGKIVCTPATALPGQSVLVDVQSPDGTSYNNTESFYISINGNTGSRHYLQFPRAGNQNILVIASSPDGIEQQKVTIVVQAPPQTAAIAAAAKPAATATAASTPAANEWPSIGLPILTITRMPHTRYTAAFNVGAAAKDDDLKKKAPSPIIPYQWNFGDGGQVVSTTIGYVEHDFETALDPAKEYQHFDVTVSRAGLSVTRTLVVYNAYYNIKKKLGILAPSVDSNDFAVKGKEEFTGMMTIYNRDTVELKLSERRFIPILPDPDQLTVPTAVERLAKEITVAPKSSVTVQVVAPHTQVPATSAGFSAYYAGQSAAGQPVRVGAHFDIHPKDRADNTPFSKTDLQSIYKEVGDALQVKANGAAKDIAVAKDPAVNPIPKPILSNVNQLLNSSKSLANLDDDPIAARIKKDYGVDLKGIIAKLNVNKKKASDPTVGDQCDPDNLPENIPANMVCQATDEQEQVPTDARIMNGRKGDVIISAGGNGIVGELLRQISPPQLWDHSGMITANNSQITHNTASQDRMMAYVDDGFIYVHGIRPDVVKYGWPGVITQTVANAFGDPQSLELEEDNNENFYDPERPANKYTFSCFSDQPTDLLLNNQWVLAQTMIVMPDPMTETEAMRSLMHTIADDAESQTGKFHYRFYCYTDPTIGQSPAGIAPAGTGSAWATGTIPGVCSSFIWLMMKKHGIHLQSKNAIVAASDLSATEKANGVKIGTNTPDGLYLYSAQERQIAGNWLFQTLYNLADGVIGSVGEFLTAGATHVANEICNAFASDNPQSSDDNSSWQQTKDANAVSPQDLTYWESDTPFGGSYGLYGYMEPVVYRQPRIDTVTISRWKKVTLKGTLSGKVDFKGKPAAGVQVQLTENMFTHTDATGNYKITDVPYGKYEIKAQLEIDGEFATIDKPVDIEKADEKLDFTLKPPSDLYRLLVVEGNMHIYWSESNSDGLFGWNRADNNYQFIFNIPVGPDSTSGTGAYNNNVNSATASVSVAATWRVDKSVSIVVTMTQDDDNRVCDPVVITAGLTQDWGWSNPSRNDSVNMQFTIANKVQEN